VLGEGEGVWEDLATAVDYADVVGRVRVALEVLVEDVHAGELL